jgi:hypothetical protein
MNIQLRLETPGDATQEVAIKNTDSVMHPQKKRVCSNSAGMKFKIYVPHYEKGCMTVDRSISWFAQ